MTTEKYSKKTIDCYISTPKFEKEKEIYYIKKYGLIRFEIGNTVIVFKENDLLNL